MEEEQEEVRIVKSSGSNMVTSVLVKSENAADEGLTLFLPVTAEIPM